MFPRLHGGRRLGAVVIALGLLVASTSNAFAHARYDWSEPANGATLDGQPFVLKAYFTQELTSKSSLRVLDAYGVQVDLGDGRVDLNDPDRKIMQVSLPALPEGQYTVEFAAESAEDGHVEPGTFGFGVGAAPAAGGGLPAGGTSALPLDGTEPFVLDAY